MKLKVSSLICFFFIFHGKKKIREKLIKIPTFIADEWNESENENFFPAALSKKAELFSFCFNEISAIN